MKLGLRYQTAYRYAERVGFAPHELRLVPRGDRFSRVRRVDVQASAGAAVRYFRDVFDNIVVITFFSEAGNELRIAVEIDLELIEKNPFDFILETQAIDLPFRYAADLREVVAPYLERQSSAILQVPGWTPPTDDRLGTVGCLVALNEALHHAITYERREEGAARSPDETLRLGRGACRDVAVLHAELLRSAGVAARLASGYLRETDAETKRAEGSLHAWVEAFLPGAGWVGLDATNGVFCNHNWIATAVGLHPAHITPIAGTYYCGHTVASEMSSRLEFVDL